MISLSMIVKNEEKYLRDCLESVKEVVDEIIIVDTGSTDKTIEIAKSFGAKIYNYEWNNDFSAARNYALEKSTCEWILYLDADERLLPKSCAELKRLSCEKNKIAYYCRIINIDTTNNRPSVMAYVRFFPNDKNVRFKGAIHEQIEDPLRKNNYSIINSSIEINHIGYNISKSEMKLKAERNLGVLLEEYKRNKNSYISYHLGQTYGMLDDKSRAVEYFRAAIADPYLKKEYKALAYRYIGLNLAEKQNWELALENVNNSIDCDPDQPLNLLAASEVFLATGKFKAAGTLCYNAYNVNRQFNRGGKFSFQSILLDENSILYQGLKIAIISGDSELFNIFFPLLKLNQDRNNAGSPGELNFYNDLINNNDIDNQTALLYLDFVDERNLDLVLTLIDKYNNEKVKTYLLNDLCLKFPANAIVHNKAGIILLKQKDYLNAEKILEQAYELNQDYPSTIFYLVSVYLHNNKQDRIYSLILAAEDKYADNADVLKRLRSLKEKINIH